MHMFLLILNIRMLHSFFAEYLVSEEGAEILYEKAYNVTARKNIENINGLKDDDALKVYTEAFDDAVPMPQSKKNFLLLDHYAECIKCCI